ncbi:unnamed protein product [Clonostachys chloroleuca]|uniref:Uncharacterized protein n=1 Tax=Clonostachys chloroleuca TaxID=1926264 RepID=A0AA35MAQ7_9HYPO|nr:unnamed protein product [Clonostachys chloroleuca]
MVSIKLLSFCSISFLLGSSAKVTGFPLALASSGISTDSGQSLKIFYTRGDDAGNVALEPIRATGKIHHQDKRLYLFAREPETEILDRYDERSSNIGSRGLAPLELRATKVRKSLTSVASKRPKAKNPATVSKSGGLKKSHPVKKRADTKKPTAAKKSAAVKKPSPIKKPANTKKSTAAKRPAAAKKPAAARKPANTKNTAIAKKPAPIRKPSPVRKPAAAKNPAGTKKTNTSKRPTAAKKQKAAKTASKKTFTKKPNAAKKLTAKPHSKARAENASKSSATKPKTEQVRQGKLNKVENPCKRSDTDSEAGPSCQLPVRPAPPAQPASVSQTEEIEKARKEALDALMSKPNEPTKNPKITDVANLFVGTSNDQASIMQSLGHSAQRERKHIVEEKKKNEANLKENEGYIAQNTALMNQQKADLDAKAEAEKAADKERKDKQIVAENFLTTWDTKKE